MNAPRTARPSSLLIGIGLVLVGLFGGILLMLFVINSRAVPEVMPAVVERVELGRPAPARAAPERRSEPAGATVDLKALNQQFRGVAGEVRRSVVYIQVEGPGQGLPRDWFHNFEGEGDRFLRELPRQSVGSGVIISPQGYVVTNHHVVDRAETILVTLADKRQFEARIVGVDPSTDLAVLRLESEDEPLPVITIGDSDRLEVGEWVLAIGNPFRLTSTVTAGIVSALGRQVNIIDDPLRIEDFIQTDAAINPGNSGGALVNLDGALVGISTAIATESGSYEGYGFAVPVNLV
ncbi:MAG: trypsin-like peptidase domain-containing protein, partial [Rhodothermales bacterium]|nr:trypsin-like peptidase domain-containing protein [Rhodothermales bacterium]